MPEEVLRVVLIQVPGPMLKCMSAATMAMGAAVRADLMRKGRDALLRENTAMEARVKRAAMMAARPRKVYLARGARLGKSICLALMKPTKRPKTRATRMEPAMAVTPSAQPSLNFPSPRRMA